MVNPSALFSAVAGVPFRCLISALNASSCAGISSAVVFMVKTLFQSVEGCG